LLRARNQSHPATCQSPTTTYPTGLRTAPAVAKFNRHDRWAWIAFFGGLVLVVVTVRLLALAASGGG
jgi:hypothetical protein